MAGFGRAPFGTEPFGISDTGHDLIIESFPTEYYDDTLILKTGETQQDNSEDPLVKVLHTYANSVFQRRLNIDSATEQLTDPDTMPLSIVELWGGLLGLGIDKNDPDFLQRTFLKTASQWLQIKASTKGYEVRGLASGFAVQVDTFWRVDPIFAPFIPLRFQFFLKPPEADSRAVTILHTDKPPGTFVGTPLVEGPLYAKSSYVQAIFSVPIYRPHVDYNKLLDLVILKIKDVVGIHQELLASIFQVILNVDASKITVEIIEIDENIEVFEFNEACYYDIIPSDFEPTDGCLGVVMITEGENENIPVNAVPSIGLIIQENVINDLTALESVSGSMVVEESTNFIVEVSHYFDIEAADVIMLDLPITVTLVTPQISITINCNITANFIECQEEVDYPSIQSGVSGHVSQINEFGKLFINNSVSGNAECDELVIFPGVEWQNHFDTVPADVMNLDGFPYVLLEVA